MAPDIASPPDQVDLERPFRAVSGEGQKQVSRI
jgi:hypothetical protein